VIGDDNKTSLSLSFFLPLIGGPGLLRRRRAVDLNQVLSLSLSESNSLTAFEEEEEEEGEEASLSESTSPTAFAFDPSPSPSPHSMPTVTKALSSFAFLFSVNKILLPPYCQQIISTD